MSPEHEHILKTAFAPFYGQLPYFECADGWYAILSDLGRQVDGLPSRATQVKEKFGFLRVYVEFEDEVSDDVYDRVDGALRDAESRSVHTCETCGARGNLRNRGGHLQVRCDPCYSAGQKRV